MGPVELGRGTRAEAYQARRGERDREKQQQQQRQHISTFVVLDCQYSVTLVVAYRDAAKGGGTPHRLAGSLQ